MYLGAENLELMSEECGHQKHDSWRGWGGGRRLVEKGIQRNSANRRRGRRWVERDMRLDNRVRDGREPAGRRARARAAPEQVLFLFFFSRATPMCKCAMSVYLFSGQSTARHTVHRPQNLHSAQTPVDFFWCGLVALQGHMKTISGSPNDWKVLTAGAVMGKHWGPAPWATTPALASQVGLWRVASLLWQLTGS